MIIKSRFQDYEVKFEKEFAFIKSLSCMENAQFVIDRNVYNLYTEWFSRIPQERLYLLDAIETNKALDTVLAICERMTEIPAKRNAVLVSVGGGITQDITGFAANILYRGISWHYVPTTLLAACDSCIGGKTSLNYKGYKNLLGTFYPPDKIYICPKFFNTLSERDYKSGLGEVVKFNLMEGKEGLEKISENIERLLLREEISVAEFVQRSLSFKKDFIETDEFDRGERIKLNFAHTFGHAIEVMAKYEIPHGTAVAIGMIIANQISVKRGILNQEFACKAEQILLKVIDIDIELLKQPIDCIIDAMKKDKKQMGKELTAVLMTDISKELIVVHDISVDEVKMGFGSFVESYEGSRLECRG